MRGCFPQDFRASRSMGCEKHGATERPDAGCFVEPSLDQGKNSPCRVVRHGEVLPLIKSTQPNACYRTLPKSSLFFLSTGRFRSARSNFRGKDVVGLRGPPNPSGRRPAPSIARSPEDRRAVARKLFVLVRVKNARAKRTAVPYGLAGG